MSALEYVIRLKNGDLELEVRGDKRYVETTFAKLKALVSLPKRAADEETPEDRPSLRRDAGGGKQLSAREFVDTHKLTKHTDIVLAFAYFLEKKRGLDSFTPADVRKCYYEAKIELTNISQMIINNIKKGFVMETAKKEKGAGRYTITGKGEKYVDAGFRKAKE
jgi:hypothetical protein